MGATLPPLLPQYAKGFVLSVKAVCRCVSNKSKEQGNEVTPKKRSGVESRGIPEGQRATGL